MAGQRRGRVPEAEQVERHHVVVGSQFSGGVLPVAPRSLDSGQQHQRLTRPGPQADGKGVDLVAQDLGGDPLRRAPDRVVVGGQPFDPAHLEVGLDPLQRLGLVGAHNRVANAEGEHSRHGQPG